MLLESPAPLTRSQRKLGIALLRDDLPGASAYCYKIKDKLGCMIPWRFNRAQEYIHERLEAQRAATGKVRALLLKGRQQGGSTYICGRFYHRVTMYPGYSAFIVAHEAKATANLYSMVRRFHAHNPYAPRLGATNAQELIFADLESGYKLATAGTQDVGRSHTAQLLHASEFAMWPNAQDHLAGIGNTVPDLPGTEVVLETTAKGQGNAFHLLWQGAEAGENEWLPLFVPWYWQPEYRLDLPREFEPTDEEREYAQAYDLTWEQMAWRRNKITTYGPGFEWLFQQEYPACAAEAFVASTNDPYIMPTLVSASIASSFLETGTDAPLVIGCDPAEYGDDSTAIVWRRGRMVPRLEVYHGKSTMEVAGILARILAEYHPDAMFIDRTGIGAGIVDRLLELGYPVIGVHNGSKAVLDQQYANRRAEMWTAMRAWFEDVPNRIPDDSVLRGDLSAPSYTFDSKGRLLIEAKARMRDRGLRSCDCADALALTFAEPVRSAHALTVPGMRARDLYRPASKAGY